MPEEKNKSPQAVQQSEDKKYGRTARNTDKYVTAKIPPLKKRVKKAEESPPAKTQKTGFVAEEAAKNPAKAQLVDAKPAAKAEESIKTEKAPAKVAATAAAVAAAFAAAAATKPAAKPATKPAEAEATTAAKPAGAATKPAEAEATAAAKPAGTATKPAEAAIAAAKPAGTATKPAEAEATAAAKPGGTATKPAEAEATAAAKPAGAATKPAEAEAAAAKEDKKKQKTKKTAPAKQQAQFFKQLRQKTFYPILAMLVICLVSGLLLGVVNLITTPIIQRSNQLVLQQTFKLLLPEADDFEEMEIENAPEEILAVYKAKNGAGYVINAQSRGYSSQVPVLVAFDKSGMLAAVKFLQNGETAGLGKEIETSKSFAPQFASRQAKEINPAEINGVAGATLSTNAAVQAVNAAINYYNTVFGSTEVYVLDAAALQSLVPDASGFVQLDVTGLDLLTAYRASNGVLVLVAGGSGIAGTVPVAVAFDEGGAIKAIWADTSRETQGYGKHIGEDEEFKAQFVGKTSAEGVNIVAGSTITSTAIKDAVGKAAAALADVRNAPELAGQPAAQPAQPPAAQPFALSEDVIKQLAPAASAWAKLDLAQEGLLAAYRTSDGLHIIVIKGEGMAAMPVAVALDSAGTITGLWMDTSGETEGFGQGYAQDENFKSQFIGQTSVEHISTETGATITANGVKNAVAKALGLLAQAQQAGEVAA